jgi:UDP-N-acetylmuramate--alanine ligase
MSRKVHFVGIGGSGMSALAHVLHGRGESVTGSDQEATPYVRALQEAGVNISIGHNAKNVTGADLVVSSSAIPESNVELQVAVDVGIPVKRRQEFLDELTRDYETVAIAGTHGKTTTTGMVAWILDQAGFDPSFVVGGLLPDFGANGKAGKGSYFVIEADEYDNAFLGLHPAIAVVTNVEHDHPDFFPTYEDVVNAFQTFVGQVKEKLIICADDPGAFSLSYKGVERITYGFEPSAHWRAEELRANAAGGMDFLLIKGEGLLGLVRTRLPGEHNVSNALAAFAVADALQIPFAISRDAMTKFHGAGQRFEILGVVNDIAIIDDYAHHPTEIRATLSTSKLRYPQAEIWAVFQPHTYSRIKTLLAAYRTAFGDADHVIVTEVFGAREEADGVISGEFVANEIDHVDVRFIGDFNEIAEELARNVRVGDVVVTMSAGDANQVGRNLLKILEGI